MCSTDEDSQLVNISKGHVGHQVLSENFYLNPYKDKYFPIYFICGTNLANIKNFLCFSLDLEIKGPRVVGEI